MALNETSFLAFFDHDSRLVKEHEFRKSVFRYGISEEYRPKIWKYLFEFYSYNSTPRERLTADKEKSIEYYLMKTRWKQIIEATDNYPDNYDHDQITVPNLPFNVDINLDDNVYDNEKTSKNEYEQQQQAINLDYVKIQLILKLSRASILNSKLISDIRQIDKDINRTAYLTDMPESTKKKRLVTSLKNILVTFSCFNQNIDSLDGTNECKKNNLGYTQGMNELASVFLSVFGDESVAYWCFSNFMLYDTYSTSSLTLNTTKIDNAHILKTNVAHYFSDIGMSKKLLHLSELLKQTDIELDEHFKRNGIKNLYFCHEWLLLMFKRCFKSTPAFLRCFEMLASHFLELHTSALKGVSIKSLYSFDLFVCLSLLKQMRHDILERAINEMEIFQVLKENASIFADNYDVTLEYAEEIFEKYCIKMKLKNENEQDSQKSKKKFIIF